MNKLIDYIRSDIKARGKKQTFGAFMKLYFTERTFRYTFWLRLRQFTCKKKLLGGVFRAIVRIKSNHLQIYVGTNDIGKGLHIVHAGNIRLNANKIGQNFKVYHGVTIGSDAYNGIPVIGDNVTCYTNSVICGSIVIGDGCKIGATAFVNHSLEPYCTVINQCLIKEKKITWRH